MGAIVPASVAENPLSLEIGAHLKMLHQGKVRDTYELPGHPDKLLVVATDRISIFDFVLGQTVLLKGEVLVALTVFWLTNVFPHVDNHLIAFGRGIDRYLPSQLTHRPDLRRRCLVVEKLQMLPVECIARGYLTGSGWKAYQRNQAVCGVGLGEGLHDGSQLPVSIFTPTTKAEVGHDEHITAASVENSFGPAMGPLTLALYERAREFARNRGVIIADTKFEFGRTEKQGAALILGDEVLTPDSSRFWDAAEYEDASAAAKSPTGYDKEPVRQAGKKAMIDDQIVDISQLDPTNPADSEIVAAWEIPTSVHEETTRRYLRIVKRLTGLELRQFHAKFMEV